jgi:large subunit ribosomal protein L35
MAHCERASRPIIQCLSKSSIRGISSVQLQTRAFQTTAAVQEEAQTEAKSQPFYKAPDPALVSSPRLERRLMRQGILPIGSRRRRAALQTTDSLPFEQLPYQCFQEARKVLIADREEKLKEIATTSEKIAKIQALPEEEQTKHSTYARLRALEVHLDRLKVLADINDPLVKKKFEDGQGKLLRPSS